MRILRGRLRCCPLLLSSLVISLVVFKENIFGPFPMLLYHAEFEIAACSPCENSTYILPVRNLTEFDKLFNSYRVYRKHVSMLKIRRTVAGHGHNLDNRCLSPPKTAVGPFSVDLEAVQSFDKEKFNDIEPGGKWRPNHCVSKQRVAIIIPYRDRQKHLQSLLYYLIPMLKRQQLDFRIFVVEQFGRQTFNKGVLLNAGFLEAWDLSDFDCFVFHDVDLIPENDKNMYTCEEYPRHMSPEIDKFDYKLPYVMLVGGVLSMPPEIYLALNGYSNLYWGWGGEDDDMAFRLYESKLGVIRPPNSIGRYRMFRHAERESSPTKVRHFLMRSTGKRFRKDGVNSVKYNVVFKNDTRLYTHLMIDVGTPPTDQKQFMSFVESNYL